MIDNNRDANNIFCFFIYFTPFFFQITKELRNFRSNFANILILLENLKYFFLPFLEL